MRNQVVSLAALLALSLSLALAAPRPIGMVVTKGSFRLDDATVNGNATLFEGTKVETQAASSTLDLTSGTRLTLSPGSRGRVFGDRLVLEKGAGEMEKTVGFHIEAQGLTIQPETARGLARVSLAGTTRVQVNALAGSLRVLNARGLLIAALTPGAALEFTPPASPQAGQLWKTAGCLRVVNGHFLLTDETTNVTVELEGPGLTAEKGNSVEITGAMDPTGTPVSGATQVIRVSTTRRLAKGCVAGKKGAAAAGAGGGAAAGASAGAGGGAAGAGAGAAGGVATAAGVSITTIAVVGGVAAAAAVGGLAAAGDLPGLSR